MFAIIFLFLCMIASPLEGAITQSSNANHAVHSIHKKTINIRVLLDEYSSTKKQTFLFTTKTQLLIKNSKRAKTERVPKQELEVLIQKNRMYKKTKHGSHKHISTNTLYVRTKSNHITLNGQEYNGIIMLKLIPKEKKLYLVNKLNLEDYVYAVLMAESYQSWPNQMQKIQAIVSRTYAMHQIIEQRNKKQRPFYDIKRNNFHQCYNGTHNFHHLRKAVKETNGLILTHKGNVVLAMFDACCGGGVPANMSSLNFDKAPYLARKKACFYCKNYQLFNWQQKISSSEFIKHLCNYKPISSKFLRKRPLNSINITDRDKAGIVHTISLQQKNKKKTTITGKDLWMSMSNLVRSQNFSIKKQNNTIIISGKGFGHQIGLCQRGARELVREGWPIKKILAFYYPNTEISKITVKKS